MLGAYFYESFLKESASTRQNRNDKYKAREASAFETLWVAFYFTFFNM
jgi:hypothetical protein